MKFGWFKWLYDFIVKLIDWLKSLDIYISTMVRLKKWKEKIRVFREKYFSEESPFITKIKHLYTTIKTSLSKK
jgi:hypothetical protein